MSAQKLILIGGGGHCKSCIEVIESTSQYAIAGILDGSLPVNTEVLGYKVFGGDQLIINYVKEYSFCIAVGQLKSFAVRQKLFELIVGLGGKLPNIVASTARVSNHSQLGIGNMIMHGVIVNAGVSIGSNNIINTNSTIEHDCTIGDHNHFSTISIINGGCSIGNKNFIGSGSIVLNGLEIGNEIVIGAGAVVTNNIQQAGTYIGLPARKMSYA